MMVAMVSMHGWVMVMAIIMDWVMVTLMDGSWSWQSRMG